MQKVRSILIAVVMLTLGLSVGLGVRRLSAGSPDSPGGPNDAAAQMFTLEQIYQRLNTGAAAMQMTTFTEPSVEPGTGTMHTLTEIYNLLGLRAPVPRTGQTMAFSAGDDGALAKGVVWPNPRFTDIRAPIGLTTGTVKDNLTGLIWLKNANCAGTRREWQTALDDVASLNFNGKMNGNECGNFLVGRQTDWRLPNVRELQSLIDYGSNDPAVPDTAGTGHWTNGDPFVNVQSDLYWSSTAIAGIGGVAVIAWYVNLQEGSVVDDSTMSPSYVWPVRGGQ
jgi:hypothetical protein